MTAAGVSPEPHRPLAGVRILDVTTVLSGPLATSMLADQGADVVKVERPGAGDLTRSIGTRRNGMTAMFLLANRGKRNIVIDLGTDAGVTVFRRLATSVDVVVQNFRPGVADTIGIGYEALRASNPELIYLSIAGFGFDGPLASMKVFDNLIQATSGIAAQQADDDGTPRFVQNLICDKLTGIVAAQALSAALYARAQGAGGQHIELSMLDTAISFLWSDAGTEHTFRGDGAAGLVSGKGNGLTRHRDGWTTVAAVSDEEFRALCVAYGRPDIADDPTMQTMAQRLSDPVRYRRMREQLDEEASLLSTEEALRRLHAAGVPAARAVPLAEVPQHPQVLANETFATTQHPVAGEVIEPRPPVRFGRSRGQPAAPAALMGAHTDEVLGERVTPRRRSRSCATNTWSHSERTLARMVRHLPFKRATWKRHEPGLRDDSVRRRGGAVTGAGRGISRAPASIFGQRGAQGAHGLPQVRWADRDGRSVGGTHRKAEVTATLIA